MDDTLEYGSRLIASANEGATAPAVERFSRRTEYPSRRRHTTDQMAVLNPVAFRFSPIVPVPAGVRLNRHEPLRGRLIR